MMNGNMGTKTKWMKWIGLIVTALAFSTVALAESPYDWLQFEDYLGNVGKDKNSR